MTAMYRDVLVDVPAIGDRRFTYRFVGEYELPYGAKVRIPFGPSKKDGFIVGKAEKPTDFTVKDIDYVYDLRFLPSPSILDFAKIMAGHYCLSLASAMSLFWPPIVPREKTFSDFSGPRTACGEDRAPSKPSENPKPLFVWGQDSFRWNKYLQLVKLAFQNKQCVLILVPEMKDIPEKAVLLREVAGDNIVVLHSAQTGLLRRQAWLDAKTKQPSVILGTRSALFSDIPRLFAVVVDQEWSESYKAPETPFFHARTVAHLLARHKDCKLVLGASHPSLESYKSIETGQSSVMKQQIVPGVEIKPIDLKKSGARREAISGDLANALKHTFSRGENALLFLNRRGEATQITCQDCGNVLLCPSCGSPLCYHSKGPVIWCHTCNYRDTPPDSCPKCGGHRWRFLGFGIEKAHKEFARRFPDIPLFRLDKDVFLGQSEKDLLSRFDTIKPACLLGTQLALNIRPRPTVGLIGVLSSDTILNLPDYTASEKLFHLLASMLDFFQDHNAPDKGLLALQTYNPLHHAIAGLTKPEEFYLTEMENRRLVGYPPTRHIFKIVFSGKNEDKVDQAATAFADWCSENSCHVSVLGPVQPIKYKIRGRFRLLVVLRGDSHDALLEACRGAFDRILPLSGIRISVDVEPQDLS